MEWLAYKIGVEVWQLEDILACFDNDAELDRERLDRVLDQHGVDRKRFAACASEIVDEVFSRCGIFD
jgi:hypothetical protein